jgi:Fuc2NAc and GlcNAc transferase
VSVIFGIIVLCPIFGFDPSSAILLILSPTIVAIVGYVDDRRGLSAGTRFIWQLLSMAPAVFALGGMPELTFGESELDLGGLGLILAMFASLWFLNLFNFMDGIDGIAATQSIFMSTGLVMLAHQGGASPIQLTPALIVGAASLGFLVWNWAPAKIFMGDVGSGFLGSIIALVGLKLVNSGFVSVWAVMILGSVFICDATATLIVRMLGGDRWYSPHRTHAYQHIALAWGSHARTTLLYLVLNIGVALPGAWLVTLSPNSAHVYTLVVFCVLLGAAVIVGAGRPVSRLMRY